MEQSNQEPILKLQGISRIYQMGESTLYALNNIDLDIHSGEFLVVLGPSGSGKSTLINVIGATDQPSAGTIYFVKQNITKASDRIRTQYRRDEIGFIFQFYNLLPTLTALENVQVATEIAKKPLDPMHALDLVGLKNLADHFPAQLSGGEQQRVAIARALASNPRILLCDEPTGALDSVTSKRVLELLVDLCKNLKKNVIFITHNEHLAKLGNRIIRLKDGKIEQIQSQTPVAVDELL